MLHDLEAGNRLEGAWLSGAVARMAKEAGGSAPVNATLYAAVKPYAMGRAAPGSWEVTMMWLLLVWLINAVALFVLPNTCSRGSRSTPSRRR